MRKSGVLAIVIAFSVFGAACGRAAKSDPMAALDDAYQSGVLSKAEYDAKKAALKAPGQMAALEDAYKSGVLTRAEYDAKRAGVLNGGQSAPAAAAPVVPPPVVPSPASVAAYQPPHPPNAAAQPTAADPAPQAAAAHANYLVMRKVMVMDQSGFERPMPSASLLLPTDWQTQGGTRWNVKDACNPISTTFQASGPDGRGFEVFPPYAWTWADDPRPLQLAFQQKAQMGTHGCDVMPPMAAADFLKKNLPRVRPNAQIVALEPMPKIMQVLQQQARQTEQMATQYRLQQRVRPDIVRARLRYSVNGRPVEEWLIVTTMTTGTMGPSMTPAGQMTQAFSYSCSAAAFAERAPQGQLESSERFFDMVVSSIRLNPEWQKRVAGNNAAIFQSEQTEIAKRSAITTQLGNDLSKIRRSQWENQQRSEDHVFAQFSQSTLGVETYRNLTSGETFELSNQYNHAWVNDRNEVVLSDQEGWDPNVALKGNWTQMQHVKQ
ncbi:MAG TPA: SHOCT domain-containing protein [Bryobacteraceae bacterium]